MSADQPDDIPGEGRGYMVVERRETDPQLPEWGVKRRDPMGTAKSAI